MKVRDIMTTPVITAHPSDRIEDVIKVMLDNRISGLPVTGRDGALVGMVTEGDFLRRGEIGTTRHRPRWLEFLVSPGRLAGEYAHTHGAHIAEVMSTDPVTIVEDDGLDRVVAAMEERHVKCLPVVRDGQVVGIVSRANVIRALSDVREWADAQPPGSDNAIRDRILSEIDREPWGPRYMIEVRVRGGTVDLRGSLFSERQHEALRVAVENTPGVKVIRDHIVLIEPNSGFVITDPDAQSGESRP